MVPTTKDFPVKYIVLGANGFIGRCILRTLQTRGYYVIGLSKAEVDFMRPLTYCQQDFTGNHLIDCVSMIDGDPKDIHAVNVVGFGSFLDWLQNTCPPFNYTYFSTVSVMQPKLRSVNPYVESKFQAERKLLKTIPSSKIIRLIFPFGLNERSNRLISRMINVAISGEVLQVDSLTLNLTPISLLADNILEVLTSDERVVQFSDGRQYYLPNIARFIQNHLNVAENIEVVGNNKKLLANPNIKLSFAGKSVEATIEEMIYSKKG